MKIFKYSGATPEEMGIAPEAADKIGLSLSVAIPAFIGLVILFITFLANIS